MTHPAMLVPPGTPNGFDVVSSAGQPFLRVVANDQVLLATPTGAPELRRLAAALLNAADDVEKRYGL